MVTENKRQSKSTYNCNKKYGKADE